MNTLVIQGSPKKDGNTATLTMHFLEGARTRFGFIWSAEIESEGCDG